jgi:hypothetical protein
MVSLAYASARRSLRALHQSGRVDRSMAVVAMLVPALAAFGVARPALAQDQNPDQSQTAPRKHKKKATPAPSDSESPSQGESAAPASPRESSSPSAPNPAPSAPTGPPPASLEPPVAALLPSVAPPESDAITNTTEYPNKRYLFIGVRYRGTIIPKFLENLFVNDGATIYSNTIGAEFEIRSAGQSMIPWIQYTDYNTGNILFFQKGSADVANNYSVVNSSLKAIYLGIDELWSTPIAKHLDFEYGFGVGIGFVFGSLGNNWVSQTSNGPLVGSNGNHYTECQTTAAPADAVGLTNGCDPSQHTDPNPHKVGGYNEANWFNGGPVPVIFPHIAIPQLSLRYKPIKQLETRLSVGFSLTGFWFGLSADYGLERKEDAASAGHATSQTQLHTPFRDTL